MYPLREFIARLEDQGELLRVTEEVDWRFEIGDRTRNAQLHLKERPALLFENIKDYPGQRVFVNGISTKARMALALGLERETSGRELGEIFRKRIKNRIVPVVKEIAAAAENTMESEEVDLLAFPIPWWSPKDIGRYIGTWHLNITKDPEDGSRNVGVYRMQLLDRRKTAISISPRSHLGIHLGKAMQGGKPLEMATVIGAGEHFVMAAASAAPYRVDEMEIAGGLQESPVELRKCKTVDLEVPASAEIVLEGHIPPRERVSEGPYLDYAGIPKSNPSAPVFNVGCVTYRDNAVFRGTAVGHPGGEDHELYALLARANCVDFHGSRVRQMIQNLLLQYEFYETFQLMGRLRQKWNARSGG